MPCRYRLRNAAALRVREHPSRQECGNPKAERSDDQRKIIRLLQKTSKSALGFIRQKRQDNGRRTSNQTSGKENELPLRSCRMQAEASGESGRQRRHESWTKR
jgi:hypothetical protein